MTIIVVFMSLNPSSIYGVGSMSTALSENSLLGHSDFSLAPLNFLLVSVTQVSHGLLCTLG